MQRKFLSWLFLLICAAFAVAGGLSFLQFQRQSEARAKDLMSSRLHDLMLLERYTQESMQHVVQINDESTLERTRAVAEIIRLNPGILKNQEELQGLCNDLGAKQLCIADERGVIIAGVPKSILGFNLSEHEQSRPFLSCITSPGYELIQRPQSNGHSGEIMQYAGVTRLDAPGLVQLGFTAQHEQIVRASANLETMAKKIMSDAKGHIIAFRDGQLASRSGFNLPTSTLLSLPINAVGEIKLGGKDYATYAIEENGLRLISLTPWREITKISFKSLRALLLSNIGLFLFMFIVVWFLLRRYVLRGIRLINHSLRRITEGYTEERVNVRFTPEFTRLSTGINAMVDSLQAYGEQKRERLQKELQLAGAIQSTVIPNKFPAFPNRKEFDIYATSNQAQVVGGDFYDFFMPDREHLCFMLGDVADSGIPAALFMMRAISIIRELANTGATPQNVLTKANKILCRDGTNMRLSLFYGRLNITSGDFRFVNAGTPQALRRQVGGSFEMLSMRSGATLGTHAGAAYSECRVTLQPGERLFLYSHGVLAAADSEHTPFGAARLQDVLAGDALTITDMLRQVRTALQHFTGNMEQNCDISMLAVEYKGIWSTYAEKTVPNERFNELTELLQQKLEGELAAPDSITELQKAMTIIQQALPPTTQVTMRLRCNEQTALLTIIYNQAQFNPLLAQPGLAIDDIRFSTDNQHSSTLELRQSL
ncbi:MAG: SpoIIE family protein phosphatase [Akkermansia sp.]|nr:SpoIIE family protein phosphatase [Akkermansia sp.]